VKDNGEMRYEFHKDTIKRAQESCSSGQIASAKMKTAITRIASIAICVIVTLLFLIRFKDKIIIFNSLAKSYSNMVCVFLSLYDVAVGSLSYGLVIMIYRLGLWVGYGFVSPETYTIKNVLHIKNKNFLVSFITVLMIMCTLSLLLKFIETSKIMRNLIHMLTFS
jgi:hypothetical protein